MCVSIIGVLRCGMLKVNTEIRLYECSEWGPRLFSIVSIDRTDSCACESIWASETREKESLELVQILLGVYIRILLKC